MDGSADYYALLGVERDAHPETIKRAFRALAREVHPDVSSAPEAEARFRAVAEAYRVLSAPGSRLLYDRSGQSGDSGYSAGSAGFDELRLARYCAGAALAVAVAFLVFLLFFS